MLRTFLGHAGRSGARRAADGALSAAARVADETRQTERVTADERLGLDAEPVAAQSTRQELLRHLLRLVLAAVVLLRHVGASHRRHPASYVEQ